MRVLALGGLWVPYIKENWFDALKHTLGRDVLCLNAGPLLSYRGKTSGLAEGYHAAYVYDLIRRDHFDCLFFYHDWIFGDYPDVFFDKIRAAGLRTVAFHPDDEPEHWYARNAGYDHHYDVVASHSSAGVARRHAAGWGERAMYLPWGYNPRTCYRLPQSPKRYDVVFIGKHKVDNARGYTRVEDGAQREDILVKLALACRERGQTFRVFGYGWDKHPYLCEYSGGIPSQEDLVRIYNETRVVFNPAWSSDGNPNAVQTKLRHFEVPGCGAFQITNTNQELAELFAPGKEIEFYGDERELLEKIEFYLRNSTAREAIANSGYLRAKNEHTLDHRVSDLFSHVAQRYPSSSSQSPPPPDIRQVRLDRTTSLTELRQQLVESPDLLADSQWAHFLGGRFEQVETNYEVVEPLLRRSPNEIVAVSTYVRFDGLAENPLQPKLTETDATVLPEKVEIDSFDFGPGGPCGNYFVGSQDHLSARVITNYIVPRKRAIELIDAFIANNVAAVDNLGALPSGRIVTEVSIRPPDGQPPLRRRSRNHEYVRRLRRLFPLIDRSKLSTVLYGISGMGEIVLELAEEIPGFAFRGIIDRSLDVADLNGIPVITPNQLAAIKPDLIILAAGASGPGIYESIAHLESSIGILPLYDLNHPTWHVLLP